MTARKPLNVLTHECGAKTKAGGHCKVPAMPNGKCYRHGGATPAGIDSANFKHGKYVPYLPLRLLPRYKEARKDGELLALREDIALIDARIADVLGRVDTGESGEMWRSLLGSIKEVQRCRKDFNQAMRLESFADLHQAGKDLSDVLESMELLAQAGVSDYAAWRDVRSLVDQRCKLTESEGKRLVAMRQMITTEEAMTMLGAVLGVIRTHVHDPATQQRIGADVRRLVAGTPGG